MRMGKGRKGLLMRLTCTLLLLTLVWAILVPSQYITAKRSLRDEVREHLMAIAIAAAASIDPESHEKVHQEGDESSPLYRQLQRKLRELSKELLPEVRSKGLELATESIYTPKPSLGDIWHFVLDSGVPYDIDGNGKIEPKEDIAHLGEPCKYYPISGDAPLLC